MENIIGNTLYVKQESGNIGHYFNDHVYSSFSYYLAHKDTIDNVCIEFTDLNLNHPNFIEHFNKKILLDGKNKSDLNFNMLIMFFYDCSKNIYIQDRTSKYSFENLIKPQPDRFFDKSINCLEVFNKLRSNYGLYTEQNNIINERIDVTLLYRNDGKDRNISNIEIFENLLKKNNIKYKLFSLSDYYNFQEIVDIFYNSDNIISFHGCELTYGIFMNKNTQIIELTPINYIERWWQAMERHYINYGLKYIRHSVNVIDNNFYLNDEICFDIFKLIKIKFYDNFVSIGERCDSAISLYNINYKKGSYPFDYIISNLKRINEIICTNGFFEDDDIISKQNFHFPHHNKNNGESDCEYFYRIKNMFNEKLQNLYNLIKQNKRILFIYTIKYDSDIENNLLSFIQNMIYIHKYNNFKILVTQNKVIDVSNILYKEKIMIINYKLDREKYINYAGTDYGDFKIRQFLQNYLLNNFYSYTNEDTPLNNKNKVINIIPIGSRCINAAILQKNNLRKMSNVFDSINVKYLKNTFDILTSNFDNLIKVTNLKKIIIENSKEIKTQNLLYDNNEKDLTFPHNNMFDEQTYNTYKKRIERFKKTKYFNTLFVFTVTDNKNTYDEIINYSKQLKIYFDRNCFTYSLLIIDITNNDKENDRCKLVLNLENIFVYNLVIHNNSYTGGYFLNDIDNDNYIKIIKLFIKENDIFVSKDEIDNISYK